jgi:DNA-binding response OmpR family regulator
VKYTCIPVIVLTSVRKDAGRRRYELDTGLQLMVADYMEKPIDFPALLAKVDTYLKMQCK